MGWGTEERTESTVKAGEKVDDPLDGACGYPLCLRSDAVGSINQQFLVGWGDLRKTGIVLRVIQKALLEGCDNNSGNYTFILMVLFFLF